MENFNRRNNKNIVPQIDYSGIGIIVGLAIQAFAILPLIIRVDKTKSAREISYFTPIMFFFSFILFSIISLTKGFYGTLIVFFIGMVFSSVLLAQKYIYEKNRKYENQKKELLFDLQKLKNNIKNIRSEGE
jgi:uncharacterized protein with PQ loop repeat